MQFKSRNMDRRQVAGMLILCIFLFIRVSVVHGEDVVLNELVERIAALEKQGALHMAAQTEQDDRHQHDMAEQRTLINELQSVVATQNQRIVSLEAELRRTQAAEAMETDMVGALRKGSNASVVQRSGASVQKMASRRLAFEGPVAFQADITTQSVSHIAVGQKIVFDTVYLNLGSGYDSSQGSFTAPEAGVYIFSTSIMSNYKPHNEIWVNIVKNGQSIASAFAYGDASRDQGSVTVVTQLAVGDQVWVRLAGLADDSLWGHGFTNFMGCLVMYI